MADKEAEKQRIIAEVQALQVTISKTNKDLVSLQSTTEQKQKLLKKNEFTLGELAAFDEKARAYKSVGRMFLLTPLSTLTSDLFAQTKQLETDIAQAGPRTKALEKQLKDSQQNLKEVIEGAKSL